MRFARGFLPQAGLGLGLLGIVLSGSSVRGQVAQPSSGQVKEVVISVFQPAPSDVRKPLMRARKAIAEERYDDAAYVLGQLLTSESVDDADAQDYFLLDPDEDYASGQIQLKAETHRLLASLPAEGRQAYELQFGAHARALLDEALAEGSMDKVADVIRKFLHTRAGYEASILAGRFELGRGRPMAAALYLRRVADTPHAVAQFEPELSILLATCWMYASMPEETKETLLVLKQRVGGGKLRLGDQEVSMFADEAQALPWFEKLIGERRRILGPNVEQWVIFRGNAQRNARTVGSSPLMNFRWRVPTCIDRADEKIIEKLAKQYRDEGRAAPPALQPLAVGDTILMRTPRKLLGVDFHSGKRIWVWPPWEDEKEQQSFDQSSQQFHVVAITREHEMHQRLWEDAAHGQISSDSKSIFLLHDLGYAPLGNYSQNRVFIGAGGIARPHPGAPKPYNQLVSLSLARQGAAQWIVGGQNGEDEPKLAGGFFLGPPLPLHGKLYALAEFNGEIRLVVLDSSNGRLLWQQQLAHADFQSITVDGARRLAAAVPSFEGGVLLCPTSAGAIAAVDISTQSLLWGYQYWKMQVPSGQRGFGMMRTQRRPHRRVGERWADATVTVADGRVLLTPIETDDLHCLDLLTGKPVWEPKKRENRLYLACVHEGNAVFVESGQVTALKLADGEPAWSTPIAVPDPPSGRGFYTDHHYYLPTAGAELLKIDLSEGKLVSSCSTSIALGNLICYRDEILSQGPDWLSTFFQTDPLRRRVEATLADNPDDADALARYGELLLQEGKRNESIETLRRASKLKPDDDTTRALLVSTLLATLRDDFAANRQHAEEIESLMDRPNQRGEFLRLMAAGWQKEGEIAKAFDAYLDLARLKEEAIESGGATELDVERVERHLSVRIDRWLQARIGELLTVANAADREQMEKTIREQLDAAMTGGETSSLRKFVRHFGAHPWAEQVRLKLAGNLATTGELLEAELMLTRLEQGGEEAICSAAAAQLARLLEREKRYEEAAVEYTQLAERRGDVVCLDGKTGKQLLAEATANHELKEAMALLKPWPSGKAEVAEAADRVNKFPSYRRTYTSQIRQRCGPSLVGLKLSYDQHQNAFVVRDGRGAPVVNVTLGSRRVSTSNFALTHARINGHLLVISMGMEIVAIDMLQAMQNASEAILWRRNLVHLPPGYASRTTSVQVQSLKHPWGGVRQVFADSQKRLIGATGPLDANGVYYMNLRELVCADPSTGETIWARENLTQGSDVFGDRELIFVAPPDSDQAQVFSALDGKELGTRKVHMLENRWATCGRNLLAWEQDNATDPLRLRLYDAWTGEEIWQEELPLTSKADLIERDEIAFIQPDGRFVVRSLWDDQPRIEATLEAEKNLMSLHVLRSSNQYIVAVNRTVTTEPNTPAASIRAISSGTAMPLVTGNMYAFDRASGQPSWEGPVAIERFGFPLDQPVESPVLLLLRHITPKNAKGSRRYQTSIMCLDRRNGRTLLQKDDIAAQTYTYDIVADHPKQTVTVSLPNTNFAIKLTDEPLEPEQPATAEPPAKPAPTEAPPANPAPAEAPASDTPGAEESPPASKKS
ncbi:MAG: PQQ-binding-like beta-propeller repeat protein [Pirellulaceae bacterium]|nr:PQQ-binding-like beta-propeller repeat protein [Pirellulaceae bacterium]